ncbi:PepSY domain-containing protein [Beijerinckia indica]|nr:PepSY domain-containing protein [Beijerinckia indica]
MKILIVVSCCAFVTVAQAGELTEEKEHRAEAQAERICFSANSTREQVVAQHLVPPFQIIQRESQQRKAESLGARLCRWKGQLVYEINLLRQDGHVIHVYFNATSGTAMADAR